MSLMLRLLSVSTALVLVSNLALAKDVKKDPNKDVIKFIKRGLESNPSIKEVQEVRIIERQPLDKPKGWEAVVVEFKLTLKKRNGKEENITQSDIIFVNGRYVSPDLIDIKTNRSLKDRIVLSLDESFYDKKHLIFGNEDAKHKIVVFSDPLCPFCREVVPELFKVAQEHPDLFALYYYHLPIQSLHPASVPLAKAIIYLKEKGDRKAIEKIYKEEFDYKETNEEKVIQELNKKLGLNLTTKDINQPWVVQELQEDMKKAQEQMVKGTPAVFFDGKFDRMRQEYKKYLPKKESFLSERK